MECKYCWHRGMVASNCYWSSNFFVNSRWMMAFPKINWFLENKVTGFCKPMGMFARCFGFFLVPAFWLLDHGGLVARSTIPPLPLPNRGVVHYKSARSLWSRMAQGEVNVYTTQICLPNSQVRFAGAGLRLYTLSECRKPWMVVLDRIRFFFLKNDLTL